MSRAQHLSESANAGFATAASLLKPHVPTTSDNVGKLQGYAAPAQDAIKESCGKLSRPRKRRKTAEETSEVQEQPRAGSLEQHRKKSGEGNVSLEEAMAEASGVRVSRQAETLRDYIHEESQILTPNSPEITATANTTVAAPRAPDEMASKPAKKRKKRAAGGEPTKRTKKQPKSAEFVIDSDAIEREKSQKSTYFLPDTEKANEAPVPVDQSTHVTEPFTWTNTLYPTRMLESPVSEPEARNLTDLLGSFAYANPDPVSTRSPTKVVSVKTKTTTKKRKIELADPATRDTATRVAQKSKPATTKKVKAVPKKALTITDLATAAYRPAKPAVDADQSTVSAFFAPQKENVADVQPSKPVKKPRKPRTKAAQPADASTKPKKTIPKKTKLKILEEDPARKLVSPESAARKMARQDFLFGTSSQLAVDESPTFIRELQHVMRESEYLHPSQTAVSPQRKSCTVVPSAPHGTSLSVGQAQRALWCESARDDYGGVIAAEEAKMLSAIEDEDDEKPPQDDRTTTNSIMPEMAMTGSAALSKSDTVYEAHGADEHDIQYPAANWKAADEVKALPETDEERNVHEAGFQEIETIVEPAGQPDDDEWMLLKSEDSPKDPITAPAVLALPSHRERALQPLDANISLSKPKTPKGKAAAASRQAASSSFVDIDEISDSDSAPTPSPPRRSLAMSPLKLTRAPATAIAAASKVLKPDSPEWPGILQDLFPRITAAIKTTPRSNDAASGPSWHEKILLYDPIVLEDLTAWLNVQGLRIIVSRHVPTEKGRKKKKAGELLMQMQNEELKAWMVQKWCEEKSICCLWREGLRGGVKARY